MSRVLHRLQTSPRVLRTWFDMLPIDALESVFRFTSNRPRHSSWIQHIDSQDLHSICSTDDALGLFAKRSLTALQIHAKSTPLNSEDGVISISIFDSLFAKLLCSAGPWIRKIAIDQSCANGYLFSSILQHCTLLQHLDLSGIYDGVIIGEILQQSSHSLVSLVLPSYRLSRKSGGVLPLMQGLEKLKFSGKCFDLQSVLASVGATLEEIEFHSFSMLSDLPIAESMRLVKAHCRALRSIKISEWAQDLEPNIADLYASYGPQLKSAYVGDMDPHLCEHLTVSCPCARFICTCADYSSTKRLIALGDHLDTILLQDMLMQDGVERLNFNSATKFCSNIRCIEASGPRVQELEIVAGILSTPRKKLEVLTIVEDKGDNFSTLLTMLAQNTGSLRHFSYTTFQIPEIDLFQDFAKKNLFLETVTIRIDESRYRFEDFPLEILEYKEAVIADMIEAFQCCFRLQELIIENPFSHFQPSRERVARTCLPFRYRRTFVSVCGSTFSS